MASKTRDIRVIVVVPCPKCGARAGELCRNPARGLDGPQPSRPHSQRRAAWVRFKMDNRS